MNYTVDMLIGEKICFVTMSEDFDKIERCYDRLVDFHRSVMALSTKPIEIRMTQWGSPKNEKLLKSVTI